MGSYTVSKHYTLQNLLKLSTSISNTKAIMSFNDASEAAKHGEFHPSTGGSEPLMKSGHQPGKLVGNDAAPEFNAQTLPAGSAPASSTYTPDPDLNNQRMYQAASSTIGGATSADVHTGLGHPGQGQ